MAHYVIVAYTSFSKTPISIPCELRHPELLTASRRHESTLRIEVVVNGTEVIEVDSRDLFQVDDEVPEKTLSDDPPPPAPTPPPRCSPNG